MIYSSVKSKGFLNLEHNTSNKLWNRNSFFFRNPFNFNNKRILFIIFQHEMLFLLCWYCWINWTKAQNTLLLFTCCMRHSSMYTKILVSFLYVVKCNETDCEWFSRVLLKCNRMTRQTIENEHINNKTCYVLDKKK